MKRYSLIQKTIICITFLVTAGYYHPVTADETSAREFGRQDQAEKIHKDDKRMRIQNNVPFISKIVRIE